MINKIFDRIAKERQRQDEKWGKLPRNHDNYKWNAILSEEVGEVAKEVLERNDKLLKEELIQVAAVAVAWINEIEIMENL